ncbi:MAG: DUF4878 domain-containing protein [Bacteroidetes bacterium]|nr:DUF4878 domain-containing protein [Bacteroidota bacterium]MBK6839487.1 DUF4878 domain-containing protein [Bacteroidota bacterium]MBK9542539.1 DUF4878 domain-containing protein [Bacteroidota bacterium]
MKLKFQAVCTVIILFFVISCGKGDSPKAVADSFLKAFHSQDFAGARKYGTEDTGKLMDVMAGFSKMVQDSAQVTEVKYEIVSEKIEGDNAVVMYKEEGKEGEIPLNLMRVDGKWKVNMTKESLNGAEGGDRMDVGATNTDSTAAATEEKK